MAFLLGDGVGERFGIDKIEIAADPTQVAHGPSYSRLKCAVILSIDVLFKVDVAVGVRELDNSPRCLESAWRACRHASQGGGDLRDRSRLGQFAFEAYVADFTWPQESK